MKKGISIPINTLVMLAIAIIVLLAATAWFMLSWTSSSDTMMRQQALKDCCIGYVSAGCEALPDAWTCPATESGFPQESLTARAGRAGITGAAEYGNIQDACGCPGSTV